VIEEAHSEHANNYTCVAENMVGSRELSVEIAVTGEFIYHWFVEF